MYICYMFMYHMLMLSDTCMFINTGKWWKSVTEVPSTLIPALFHEGIEIE